ncbi:hypothetical protein PQI07_19070 [Methylobacterium sp. 092160098-2]|uniref:hypothetical protein n=1 Tax=Methylobacterium sp. 092160098-2 TaxID=3025129 RepID=UPI002381BA0B|nr:hypothetical protein [Methylobacterium sp. 092160098-2]MDE4912787.1 hypothetical protein [Methylobacterium sp. 092160098-2]
MLLQPIADHSLQLFVLVNGRLAPGSLLGCRGAAEACRIAEEKVRIGRAIGAAAFTRTVMEPDYDDGGEPVTLAIFGMVPAGLAEQLPF